MKIFHVSSSTKKTYQFENGTWMKENNFRYPFSQLSKPLLNPFMRHINAPNQCPTETEYTRLFFSLCPSLFSHLSSSSSSLSVSTKTSPICLCRLEEITVCSITELQLLPQWSKHITGSVASTSG